MSLNRTTKLFTGAKIPLKGLGTWRSEPNLVCNAVKVALNSGYRHLDCAWVYQNESEVGQAIKESGVPREELFITSKLWNTFHHPDRVEKSLDESLKKLGLDYVDLYLIHWPVPQPHGEGLTPRNEDGTMKLDTDYTLADTWKVMEDMVKKGKAKHIGLSNSSIKFIKQILEVCTIQPAANQVELHPFLPQHELLKFCNKKNIHVTAYSPLGSDFTPRVLDNPVITEIATKHNVSPAQVALAWNQQRGCSVIPKSVKEHRIIENFEEIELSQQEIEAISNLGINKRFVEFIPGIFD